ncbi:radical SAM protein [Streptomyces sp. NPDC057908]|uniref:radical SAM protein n=1 Tax=Streptomyces sp. NPDC057908 TaxID=3346276 RepID=UPI0036E35451
MIGEVIGIRRIRMLYLQLLYRCNFECLHCFHGKRLKHADAFTADEAVNLLTLMRDQYGTEAVTLLGGEPFVYKDLAYVVRYAKQELGMQVEICTNGYRIERRLTEIAPTWTCCAYHWRASARPTTTSASSGAIGVR